MSAKVSNISLLSFFFEPWSTRTTPNLLADDEGSALARALWFRKGTGRDRTHDPPVTWHACRDVGPGIEPRPTDDAAMFIYFIFFILMTSQKALPTSEWRVVCILRYRRSFS